MENFAKNLNLGKRVLPPVANTEFASLRKNIVMPPSHWDYPIPALLLHIYLNFFMPVS